MSGGPRTHAPLPGYDANELRRRIPVCFTIGELYRLADKLQVPQTPAWSNNPQEAARDIVRHFERSGALAFLVEALREAKPLVEWPEPVLPAAPPPASPSAPAPAPAAPAPLPTVAPRESDRPTPISSVSPAVLASFEASSGFAPVLMPKPGEAPAILPAPAAPAGGAAPAPAAPRAPAGGPLPATRPDLPPIQDPHVPIPGDAPASARAAGPAWPGTFRSPAPAAKSPVDARILLGAGAALLVIAVAVAFYLGRASSSSTETAAAAERPADQVALAEHVAIALSQSLERVARSCKIEVASLRGRSLFEVAYRRCGPLPQAAVDPAKPSLDLDPSDADPAADPADPANPAPTKKGGGGKKLQRVDSTPVAAPASGATVCLSGCQKSHKACTARCGAEPTQGSQYDAYQGCLSGCLKAMSHCKLGCQ